MEEDLVSIIKEPTIPKKWENYDATDMLYLLDGKDVTPEERLKLMRAIILELDHRLEGEKQENEKIRHDNRTLRNKYQIINKWDFYHRGAQKIRDVLLGCGMKLTFDEESGEIRLYALDDTKCYMPEYDFWQKKWDEENEPR